MRNNYGYNGVKPAVLMLEEEFLMEDVNIHLENLFNLQFEES